MRSPIIILAFVALALAALSAMGMWAFIASTQTTIDGTIVLPSSQEEKDKIEVDLEIDKARGVESAPHRELGSLRGGKHVGLTIVNASEEQLITKEFQGKSYTYYLAKNEEDSPLQASLLVFGAKIATGGLLLAAGALMVLASFLAQKRKEETLNSPASA